MRRWYEKDEDLPEIMEETRGEGHTVRDGVIQRGRIVGPHTNAARRHRRRLARGGRGKGTAEAGEEECG